MRSVLIVFCRPRRRRGQLGINTPSQSTLSTTNEVLIHPLTSPYLSPMHPNNSIDQGKIIVDGREGDYHDPSMTSFGQSVSLDLSLGMKAIAIAVLVAVDVGVVTVVLVFLHTLDLLLRTLDLLQYTL